MQSDLLTRVMDIQRAEGLSDREFARKLGLSNGQWSGVKSGRIRMGRKTLRALLRLYPQLRPAVEENLLAAVSA